MKPLHVTIEGAHGIRAGLGVKSIDVDLGIIPDDAVSVAIKGDNGTGKSTLLNLGLTPWREPPQLAGNIYDHFEDHGLRQLVWEHGGDRLRSRIEYRQTPKTRSQRAYLHRRRAATGEWEPVTLPDGTVSDGKSSTYDACLTHILGNRDIYYLSAFQAQGAAPLSSYDDPKALMRSLLSLDEPEALRGKAQEVTRELKRKLGDMHADERALDDAKTRLEYLTGRETMLESELAVLLKRQQTKSVALSAAKAEMDRATAENLDEQRIADERRKAQDDLDAAVEDARKRNNSASNAAQMAESRLRSIQAQQANIIAALEHDANQAQHSIETAGRVLARADEITAASERATVLSAEINAKEQTLDSLREQLVELNKLAADVRALEGEQKRTEDRSETLRRREEELVIRAGFVDQVPCRGAGEYAECPALREAKTAAEGIPLVRDDLLGAKALHGDLRDKIAGLRGKTAQIDAVTTEGKDLSAAVRGLRERLKGLEHTAAQASTLKQAQTVLDEAQSRLDGLAEREVKTRARFEAEMESARSEVESLTEEAVSTDIAGKVRVEKCIDALNALPEPTKESVLRQATVALSNAEQAYQNALEAVESATQAKVAAETEAAWIRKRLAAGEELRMAVAKLSDEIATWTLLSLALRGVVDLSIEDAGPSIAGIANELLTEAYGPRFSIHLITQREQANGKLVETFDVAVIDAETGLESSIIHKSGGETVWLDKALRDAVGLYHQDVAGIRYGCLFADESEDGLTAERKTQFYRMDRAMLRLGGYERKFAISHNPEAWSLADYVLDMGLLRSA